MWTSSSPENSYWIPAQRAEEGGAVEGGAVGRGGQWRGRGSGEGLITLERCTFLREKLGVEV